MKTITKRSLDELAKEMPVLSEMDLRGMVGGTGTFTEEEFLSMYITNEWEGGQVEGWGSLGKSFDSVSMISGELYIDGKNKDGELAPDFLEDEDTGFQDDPFASDSGFSGDSGIVDSNDYQLETLISQLSTEERQLLEKYGAGIVIDPNCIRAGEFHDASNQIVLKSYDLYALRAELIHLKQADLGAIGSDNPNYSNAEFQEGLMSYFMKACSGDVPAPVPITDSKFVDWASSVTHGFDKSQPLDLNVFNSGVDYFYNVYRQEMYQKYLETGNSDYLKNSGESNASYQWNWLEMFKYAGFSY